MGVLDWMKQQGNNVANEVKKITNKDFMEAVAAGCALVASADGSISSEEKQKMVGFINVNESLKLFKLNDIIEKFNSFVSQFEFDHAVGKLQALKSIEKMKKKPHEAKILISVCISVGASDGNFDKDEVAVVKEMCQVLGLDPQEFSL